MTTARRLWWAAVAATVAFLVVLGAVEWIGWVARADRRAEHRIRRFDFHHARLDHLALWVTKLGDPRLLTIVVVVAAVALVLRRRSFDAIFVIMVSLTGALLNRVAKAMIGRERPSPVQRLVAAHGQSFPSGHAMGAAVVLGALLLVLWPRLNRVMRTVVAAGVVGVVGLVALSRVLLGAHWPLDVVAGVLLGVAWVSACGAIVGSRRVATPAELR